MYVSVVSINFLLLLSFQVTLRVFFVCVFAYASPSVVLGLALLKVQLTLMTAPVISLFPTVHCKLVKYTWHIWWKNTNYNSSCNQL